MNNYKFTFDENISIKNSEPLLNCEDINSYTENNYVSKFFYNLYVPFKNNELLEELDKILQYSNRNTKIKKYIDTINADSWLKYKIAKNITIKNMSETIIKSRIIIKNEDDSISVNYIKNAKSTTMNFEDKELYDNKANHKLLFNMPTSTIETTENILYLHKETYCKSNREFLYNLLNCLFSSNSTYYLKKCERCHKYFLATLPNKRMCNRVRTICGEQTICCNASKVFYKSKEYKQMFRMIENHLKPYYEDNDSYHDYIGDIRDRFKDIKENCIKEDRYDRIKESIEETKELINN